MKWIPLLAFPTRVAVALPSLGTDTVASRIADYQQQGADAPDTTRGQALWTTETDGRACTVQEKADVLSWLSQQ